MRKNLMNTVCTNIFTLSVACAALAAIVSGNARAGLLTNGDFESGLTGWTVTDQLGGSGSFFANPNDGTGGPLSGFGTPINPLGGTMFALSDQTGPGAHALTQAFVVPVGASSVTMTFDLFMNDFSGPGTNPTVDPAGLDYTVGSNQHARIDILTSTASALSTAPADIVTSVLFPVPPPAVPGFGNPWISSPVFDLTAALGAGGTFQVRFAEVDNLGNLNLGVDNVDIVAATGAVPEPSSLAIFGIGALGVVVGGRRRRS